MRRRHQEGPETSTNVCTATILAPEPWEAPLLGLAFLIPHVGMRSIPVKLACLAGHDLSVSTGSEHASWR